MFSFRYFLLMVWCALLLIVINSMMAAAKPFYFRPFHRRNLLLDSRQDPELQSGLQGGLRGGLVDSPLTVLKQQSEFDTAGDYYAYLRGLSDFIEQVRSQRQQR